MVIVVVSNRSNTLSLIPLCLSSTVGVGVSWTVKGTSSAECQVYCSFKELEIRHLLSCKGV